MPKPRILTFEEIDILKQALEKGEDWVLNPRRGDVRARLLATLDARTKQTDHWRDTANQLTEERNESSRKGKLKEARQERDEFKALYDDVLRIQDEVVGQREELEERIKTSELELFNREKEVLARELEAADAIRTANEKEKLYAELCEKKNKTLEAFYKEKGIKNA